ncbi:lysophospholipid acyltransferase family protein [Cognatishimia sp. WU-CL00825]|uniref:lysophospholipid acyltransferase family protein n=1 Tax=Cognatishimia sp. WU-CL00825 TaxID=3127658 RepID=UPI003107D736
MQKPTWNSENGYPDYAKITGIAWLSVVVRGVLVLGLLALGLLVLLALRLIEKPLFGLNRPWSPRVTQFVCRNALRFMGIRFETKGKPMRLPGAMVANHASWLDIFVLNARDRLYFVSKSEVAAWPGIGTLAKATGTVFITRDRKEAKAQQDMFEQRLSAGHKLLFFPEGTSTDSLRVLPFKSTLFAAFFSENLKPICYVQPVSVSYRAPDQADQRHYAWWGDMEFGPHMLQMLASRRHGKVEVVYHEPVAVADFANRKELTSHLERQVRAGHYLTQDLPHA